MAIPGLMPISPRLVATTDSERLTVRRGDYGISDIRIGLSHVFSTTSLGPVNCIVKSATPGLHRRYENALHGCQLTVRRQLPERGLSRQTFQTREDVSATLTLWAQATREADDECR